MYRRAYPSGRGGSCSGRLIMAAIVAIASVVMYLSSRQDNPVTGETQYIDITPQQEIALGLQAVPEMTQEFGGEDADRAAQNMVDQVGFNIVNNTAASQTPYQFDFHLLGDRKTINAFALPGGQVFITRALFDRLQTEGELGGVLGHEIGHVVARHSAEQIAKARLTEGLTGAAVIASYDPQNPSSAQIAQMAVVIGQLVNMKFSRDDELEADFLGVCFIDQTGYDPRELVGVMQILADASKGQSPPEFLSTHPNPGNRVQRIEEAIQNIDQCPRQ